MSDITLSIYFFASSREFVGTNKSTIKLSKSITANKVKEEILKQFPILEKLNSCFVLSLNEEYIDFDSEELLNLKIGDTIAVIPPLSGG